MLIESLRESFGGTTVYVRKRPRIDWTAVRAERDRGVTAATLARRLGVSERTVLRNTHDTPTGEHS
jgi:hypothetical protein